MVEKYIRKYLVRGRERSGHVTRRQDMVKDIVKIAMERMDVDSDGVVSLDDYMSWAMQHDLEALVNDYIEAHS